jgi:hypothetical protein
VTDWFSAWDRIKVDQPRYKPVSRLLQPVDDDPPAPKRKPSR